MLATFLAGVALNILGLALIGVLLNLAVLIPSLSAGAHARLRHRKQILLRRRCSGH